MRWYRRLRWRLIGVPLLAVLVGVGMTLAAIGFSLQRSAPAVIRPILEQFAAGTLSRAAAEFALIAAFSRTVFLSVLVAAAAALLAGVIFSLILWRILILPLRQMASASRRVAAGRYDERVPLALEGGEALQQLVTSFNEMAAMLQRVEEQRLALIANVAHELRTPLTGLQGYVEGMADGLFPATTESYSVMEQEIGRLVRLVTDLQSLSRVEAGAIHLAFDAIDLPAVVARVVAGMQPRVQGRNLTLTVSADPGLPPALADGDRTAQIVGNLIGNAVRYTPPGGRISVRTVRRTQPPGLQVVVQDSGIGIDSADLPWIFERFYRAEPSRSRESGGLGLGLTISRRLAWTMGGDIEAASPGSGQGSTFTLTLPPASAKTAQEQPLP